MRIATVAEGDLSYLELPPGVSIDACLPRRLPVRRQGRVSRILPILKDLMQDLGHDGCPQVGRAGVVRVGDLALGDSDASVRSKKAEEVSEGENSREDVHGDNRQEDDGAEDEQASPGPSPQQR